MHILLTGASGFIGQHLLMAFIKAGYKITACVRHPEPWQKRYPDVKWIACDYRYDTRIEDWRSCLKNIDLVINAVGLMRETTQQSFKQLHTDAPCALFTAAAEQGVKKIIQISALGAETAGAHTAYHRSKRAADQVLQKLALPSVILYPALIYGRGGGSATLFNQLAISPFIPLINQGEQPVQVIAIEDFVHCVCGIIENYPQQSQCLPIVGGEAVTWRQFLSQLRQHLTGKTAHFFTIPLFIWQLIAKIGDYWSSMLFHSDSLYMLQHYQASNNNKISQLSGYTPRAFSQVLQQQPSYYSDYWGAWVQVITPFLRLSIAFIWLFTGIVSAFLYPVEESYVLLSRVGIDEPSLQAFALYSAASLDFAIGIALLKRFAPTLLLFLQLSIVGTYTILISFYLPELWLHPFGAISKNIPLLVAMISLWGMERRLKCSI